MDFWMPVIKGVIAYIIIVVFAVRFVSSKWHPDGGRGLWEDDTDQKPRS